jgi:hypothetical protein
MRVAAGALGWRLNESEKVTGHRRRSGDVRVCSNLNAALTRTKECALQYIEASLRYRHLKGADPEVMGKAMKYLPQRAADRVAS